MCGLPEQLVLLCTVLAGVAAVFSAKFDREFHSLLQERHPELWASFGKTGFFKHDESPQQTAAGWYLIAGSYVYLGDEMLTAKGGRARFAIFSTIALFAAAMMLTDLPTYGSIFVCVPF